MALKIDRWKPLTSLASLKLTVISLFLMAGLVVGGTIMQSVKGVYAAQQEIFQSWLFWLFGVLPLPGMLLIGALMFVNLSCAVILRLKYNWPGLGLLLIHIGLLVLLGGGFIGFQYGREYFMTLSEGESSRIADSAQERIILPLRLTLLDFEKTVYPGTEIPKSFTSRVQIESNGLRREALISMNRPLRFRGYTFYQSAYGEDGLHGASSTFAVVKNIGRWLPYISSLLIFLGLVMHFIGHLAAALKKSPPEVRS